MVAINGIPIENSEANDTPKTEDTSPQKSNETDPGNTSPDDASSPSIPASTKTIAPTEPKADKDNKPRPILVLYSPRTETTTPTPTSTPTQRPILIILPSTTTTPSTATPTTATPATATPTTPTPTTATPSTADPSTTITPRPIFIFYSPNTTTSTAPPTTDTTTTSPVSSTTPVTSSTTVSTTTTTSPSPHGTAKPKNFLRGYNCPQRNGFFRYPDSCDVYIVCEDYIPFTYICPDGLQFNPKAKEHDYVCDVPSVVKCKPKETKQSSKVRPILILNSFRTTARPNLMQGYSCPSRQGFFSYPGSCDSYIKCEVDTPYRYTCPQGLHFKPDAMWTEYPCIEPSVARCENGPWEY
ncbi:mucin-2-like isoform X2 [Maniola jurtina]|uniref:mucin-2-like isoform X2 n=1 Tax=Maniola jurtina TaxID=191418 RepID=UPI001E686392|nr:mucin-2-like isoform X2 [Maniola jurtina]